ncbi:hypothetical protein NT241_003275 [Salmonella enterica]|nr:hypothetical protein [Salmonella enterica]
MKTENPSTITPDEVRELYEDLNKYISHTDARQVADSANRNGAENMHGLDAYAWARRFAENTINKEVKN